MSNRDLICNMCFYQARTNRKLIWHCLSKHKNDGHFTALCTVGGCLYATTSYNAFKIHVRRKHSRLEIPNDVYSAIQLVENDQHPENYDLVPDLNINQEVSLDSTNTMHNRSFVILLAKYFLSLETEHKVSKVSLSDIALGTQNMMSRVCQYSSEEIRKILTDCGKSEEEITEILQNYWTQMSSKVLLSADKFLTTYSREEIYVKLCKLINPVAVGLGYKEIRKKQGRIHRKQITGYYIPVRKMLEALLNLPEMWHWFRNPLISTDGLQRDVNDGAFVKNSPLNRDPTNFLKLNFYLDEVEIQNPLRSSHKYKLCMFYYQILNIPVEFRSKLTSIFLYGMCRSKDLANQGLDKMLTNFTSTMNQLSTTGVNMTVNGREQLIKGTLVFVVADVPAASMIGRFKMSSSFANKPCRRCFANQESLREHFLARDFRLRTLPHHKQVLDDISDPTISKQTSSMYSRLYGVTGKSPLLKIHQFDVTKQIIFDTMHLISEGVACNLLALFFHRCIIEYNFFSLKWLNRQIAQYPFPRSEHGHLPEEITRQQIVTDFHIKQKAVAMMSLLFALPHILGAVFITGNDDHYRHFVSLVKIAQIAFSPYSNEQTACELEDLVHYLGTKWTILYPMSRIKPKLHYLVHLSEQLRNFGSLHGLSCLRFESKHGWFKDWRTKCFKNLSLSLSRKHQFHLCHQMLDINGLAAQNFVYTGDEIAEGTIVTISRSDQNLYNAFVATFGHDNSFAIYETNKVIVQGIEYENNCALLLEMDELGHPTFGLLCNIFVKEEVKYFAIEILEAECYIWQFHSYVVNYTDTYRLVRWGELKNKFPLKMHKIGDKKLIMNRYCEYSGPV